jgi:nucleoside-diphosphate-sugar epimerase
MEAVTVTGAGGFIGGHLVKSLLADGYRVKAVDIKPLSQWSQRLPGAKCLPNYDLRDTDFSKWVIQGKDKPTKIFNLGCNMGGMDFITNHRADCMQSVLINTNLLRASLSGVVDRYFFSSSACVYRADKQDDASVTALREEDAYPAQPEAGYGWEKLFSELMCEEFMGDYGLETRVARFHNVYGQWTLYDGERAKAPAAICRKVIEAKLSGNHQINIWGDGEQTRSFMYVDDCITGIRKIMDSDIRYPINLGSSELVTINQLVSIVEEIAEVKLERNYDLTSPQGVRGRNSDNTRILSELGWEPSISLRDGLEKTFAWVWNEMTK